MFHLAGQFISFFQLILRIYDSSNWIYLRFTKGRFVLHHIQLQAPPLNLFFHHSIGMSKIIIPPWNWIIFILTKTIYIQHFHIRWYNSCSFSSPWHMLFSSRQLISKVGFSKFWMVFLIKFLCCLFQHMNEFCLFSDLNNDCVFLLYLMKKYFHLRFKIIWVSFLRPLFKIIFPWYQDL